MNNLKDTENRESSTQELAESKKELTQSSVVAIEEPSAQERPGNDCDEQPAKVAQAPVPQGDGLSRKSAIFWVLLLVGLMIYAYRVIMINATTDSFGSLADGATVLSSGAQLLVGMGILTVAAIVCVLLFHWVREKELYMLFCVVLLAAGVFIAMVTPVMTGFDEFPHFFKTIATLDGKMLNYQDYNYNISDSYILLRDSLGESIYSAKFAVPWAETTTYVEALTNGFAQPTYPSYGYLFCCLGVGLARLLGGNVATIFLSGRIFNVIGYVLLVAISFGLLPKQCKAFRNAMVVLSALPGTLFVAATYSQDGTVYGIIFVLVSLFLRMYYSKDHSVRWEYIVFTALLFLLGPMKYPYILLVVLLFLVPKEKFQFSHAKWIHIAYTVALCIFVVLWYLLVNTQFKEIRNPGVDGIEQIKYCFTHIPQAVITIVSSFFLDFFGFISNTGIYSTDSSFILGHTMEWIGAAITAFVLVFLSGRYDFGWKKRIWMVLQVLGILGITYAALYASFTGVGAGRVLGVQGRYFYSLLLLIPFCMPKNKLSLTGLNQATVPMNRKVLCVATVFLCYYLFGSVLCTLG